MEDKASLWDWIDQLSDPSEERRRNAIELIVQRGQSAAPILVRIIDNELIPQEAIRLVRTILAETKPQFDGEQPDVLMEALEDSVYYDACTAVTQALVNFGPAATAPLLALLYRGDKEIYRPAAHALSQLARMDRSIMPAVIKAMVDENWNVRSGAIQVLFDSEPPLPGEGIPLLIRSLDQEDSNRRSRIVGTLEQFGAAAIPALLQALRSPDSRVRAGSARALGLIETGRKLRADRETYSEMGVVAGLVEALTDGEVEVMRAAGDALSMIGPPETTSAIPAFLNILRERNPLTFRAAAAEMGWIPSTEPGFEAELVDALGDPDGEIRASAANLLGRLEVPATSAAIPALLEAINDKAEEGRFEAAVALARIAPEISAAGVPILHAVLAHGGDWTYMKYPARPWERRRAAVNALMRHGAAAKEAVPGLIDALSEYCLADAAADALGSIGPAASPVVPALLQLLESADEDIHTSAARALAAIGPESAAAAVTALMDRLREPGELNRGSAADCLAEIGKPAAEVAIPVLMEVMREESKYIRYHAGWALRVLGCDVPDSDLGLLANDQPQ
jgi:HEAT repeat protein